MLGQYLPQPDGGVRDEGLGRMCWQAVRGCCIKQKKNFANLQMCGKENGMDNELQTNITTEQTYHSIRHSIVSAQRSLSAAVNSAMMTAY